MCGGSAPAGHRAAGPSPSGRARTRRWCWRRSPGSARHHGRRCRSRGGGRPAGGRRRPRRSRPCTSRVDSLIDGGMGHARHPASSAAIPSMLLTSCSGCGPSGSGSWPGRRSRTTGMPASRRRARRGPTSARAPRRRAGLRAQVDLRVRLVGAQLLRGQRDRRVHERRRGGAGEERVVDVGQQSDPTLDASRGSPSATSGHSGQSAIESAKASMSPPASVALTATRAPHRYAATRRGRHPPRLPGDAALLGGLVVPVPLVVERLSRHRPAAAVGDRLQRVRAAGARVDQRREQVEGDGPHAAQHAAQPAAQPATTLRSSSTGCWARRIVPCAICCRQETPVAATTVVRPARRAPRGRAGPRPPTSTPRSARPRSRTTRPCRSSRRRPRPPRRPGSAQQRDRRGGPDLGLLVAVAVVEHPPPGEPRVRRAARAAPSSIASASSSSTCRTRPATSRTRGSSGSSARVLVAQRRDRHDGSQPTIGGPVGVADVSSPASRAALAFASSTRPFDRLARPQQPPLSSRTVPAGRLQQLDRRPARRPAR